MYNMHTQFETQCLDILRLMLVHVWGSSCSLGGVLQQTTFWAVDIGVVPEEQPNKWASQSMLTVMMLAENP